MIFYLTYKGEGTYNAGKYTFISGKTIKVDEKTYKHLISPLFVGRIVKESKTFPPKGKRETAKKDKEVEDKVGKDKKG